MKLIRLHTSCHAKMRVLENVQLFFLNMTPPSEKIAFMIKMVIDNIRGKKCSYFFMIDKPVKNSRMIFKLSGLRKTFHTFEKLPGIIN